MVLDKQASAGEFAANLTALSLNGKSSRSTKISLEGVKKIIVQAALFESFENVLKLIYIYG